MYKFLSILLAFGLLVLGIFLGIEKYQHNKDVANLNKQIAQNEKTVQETQNSYSKLAVTANNLKSENSDLQKKIKDRDEKVLSLTQLNFKLKNENLQINDAKQSNVQQGSTLRTRVDFSKSTNVVDVSGFTLTNPPEAQIGLSFKPLNLQLDLVKDNNGIFRIYLDDKNSDFSDVNLDLRVDSSVLNKKWYELIGFNGGVMIGNSILVSNVGIQIKLWNFLFGPTFGVSVGPSVEKIYGVQFTYFPFEKSN